MARDAEAVEAQAPAVDIHQINVLHGHATAAQAHYNQAREAFIAAARAYQPWYDKWLRVTTHLHKHELAPYGDLAAPEGVAKKDWT